MRTLLSYFLQGCLVTVPGVITVYAVYSVGRWVDGLLRTPAHWAGLLVTVVAITLAGAFFSNVIGLALLRWLESLVGRVPIVRLVYTTARDILEAFVGQKRSFDQPVAVRFGADGPRAMGFVTREDLEDFGLPGQVAVYFPQSYNVAGNLLVFPRQQVEPLDADAAKVMALLLSGGMASSKIRR